MYSGICPFTVIMGLDICYKNLLCSTSIQQYFSHVQSNLSISWYWY